MRVLVVSHACASPINREKLHALARRGGLDVSLLLPRRWREGGRVLEAAPGEEEGVRIFTGETAMSGRIGAHFYRGGLLRALRASRPEVIHVEEEPWSLAAAQAAWAARLLGLRPGWVLFTFENREVALPWLARALERRALARADVILAGGRTVRERVLRRGAAPERVEVLHQFGLDPERYRLPAPGERPEVFTVGFVGRMVPEKGADLLLRALAGLGGEWRAVLVGDGPERGALEVLAAGPGLAGRVRFPGWLDHREVPALLRGMHALALPSRTTPSWAEQFGHVLIEAMSSGAVPVGADSGEIPHVIGGEGLVFPEGDAAALAAALRRLRDEPGLRERLASAGRSRVLREFTWEVLAERTHAVYERARAAVEARGR